jgi:hypothetical protein
LQQTLKGKQAFYTSQDNNLNQIRDMMAGLSQFQEGKEVYALHLNMVQDAITIFQSTS